MRIASLLPVLFLAATAAAQSDGTSASPSTSASQPAAETETRTASDAVPMRAVRRLIATFIAKDPAGPEDPKRRDPEEVFREFAGKEMPEEDFQVALTTIRQAASDIDAIHEEAREALNNFKIDGIRIYDTAFMRRLDERRQRVYLLCAANLEKRLSPEGWAILKEALRTSGRKP